MQLKDLAITLRNRTNFDAIELGFKLVNQWFKPLQLYWLIIALPVYAIIMGIGFWWSDFFNLGLLIIWWLKPLFERFIVIIISRLAFSESVSPTFLIKQVGFVLFKTNLLYSLTLGRFSLRRSLVLPVDTLENLPAGKRGLRRRVIARYANAPSFFLGLTCILSVYFLWFSLIALISMFLPESLMPSTQHWLEILGEYWSHVVQEQSHSLIWKCWMLLYLGIELFITPFYVVSGFCMYLNQRTILEAWDLEIQFKTLNHRWLRKDAQRQALEELSETKASTVLTIIGTLALVAGFALPVQSVEAQPQSTQGVNQVLQELETDGNTKYIQDWHIRLKPSGPPEPPAPKQPPPPPGIKETAYVDHTEQKQPVQQSTPRDSWLDNIGSLRLGDALSTILIIAILVSLGYLGLKIKRELNQRKNIKAPPPTEVAGFDISPESLPDELSTVAKDFAYADIRASLSLLVRGALSSLAHEHHIPFAQGDTELDCIRRTEELKHPDLIKYFKDLLDVWQIIAYAHATVPTERVIQLSERWDLYFSHQKKVITPELPVRIRGKR